MYIYTFQNCGNCGLYKVYLNLQSENDFNEFVCSPMQSLYRDLLQGSIGKTSPITHEAIFKRPLIFYISKNKNKQMKKLYIFFLKICRTLGHIVSLILLNLGHVFRWRCKSETRVPSSRGLVKRYNQELCISSNSRCFTKSRPLNCYIFHSMYIREN